MMTQRLLATALAMAVALPAAAQEIADRIFIGGPVLTMNDAQPRADAVAVKDGTIIAVGTVEEIMALKGEATEVTELDGRALVPGFVDAHGHVMMGGLQAVSANLLAPPDGEVTDIASLQQTLRDWMAANADAVSKVGLIIGFGYDNSQLAELRHPTREDLDAVSTEYPIFLVHQSSHLGAMNSKALELVGYTRDTPDPAGGVIRRDANGDPDGVVEENALYNAMPKILGMIDRDGFKAMAVAGSELWTSFGYTTADEGSATPGSATILKEVASEGGFKIDIAIYPNVLVDRDFVKETYSETYEGRARVAGTKLVIDGSPQGFTAYRDRPYYAPVGNYPPGYRGYAAANDQQVLESIDWAYANDIPILTHSNGEAASDLLIAAVGAAEKAHGNTSTVRPVLIHGQFLREDQVDSIKALGIFPSLFPMHTFYWGDWHRDHTIGPVSAENISPTGWVTERGMMFASHHDAPVAFPDSMRVLDATVTRRTRSGDILGPAQRVDVMTALKAMTIWPAWSHHEEDRKGSIEVGKLADLVILSGDPTAIDPETLDTLKVAETIKDGGTVYLAGQKEGRLHYMPMQDGSDPYGDFLRKAALRHESGNFYTARGLPVPDQFAGLHSSACVARYLTAMIGADSGLSVAQN
jgi:predicted amidohydrolase YtcJ